MAKKQSKSTTKSSKHFTKTSTHFMVRRSLFIYALLVFALFFMLVMTVYCFTQLAEHKLSHDRLQRAKNVYNSLNLGDSNGDDYRSIRSTLKQADLDKNDDGSYYAVAEYAKNAAQYTVRSDIAKKATDAGFKRTGGNGDDALTTNDVYENVDGDVLRVVVRGKWTQDALTYGVRSSQLHPTAASTLRPTKTKLQATFTLP